MDGQLRMTLTAEVTTSQFNPRLTPWVRPAPNNVAGKGYIERPGQVENIVWQTRATAPSAYENALGDALEQVFAAGAESLADVVAGLNRLNLRMPTGDPWTDESFAAELARLGGA